MNRTTIAWTVNPDGSPGFTWSPVIGCSRVSPGCERCYAERLAATRFANIRAAKRRGCRITTCPVSPRNPPSNNIWGIWVDLPDPVGASITIRR